MYTSIVLVALTGSVAAGESLSVASPAWHSDYEKALSLAAQANKPLAVFIGQGEEGYDEVSRQGHLNGKAGKVLSTGYVCVYLDTKTEAGRRLAERFEISKGPGLVLSDAGGKHQAFRHKGELSNKDLERYLVKYADPTREAKRTEYHRRVVRAPVRVYRPAPVMMMGGGGGGGC
jgi:hypothetical protein